MRSIEPRFPVKPDVILGGLSRGWSELNLLWPVLYLEYVKGEKVEQVES